MPWCFFVFCSHRKVCYIVMLPTRERWYEHQRIPKGFKRNPWALDAPAFPLSLALYGTRDPLFRFTRLLPLNYGTRDSPPAEFILYRNKKTAAILLLFLFNYFIFFANIYRIFIFLRYFSTVKKTIILSSSIIVFNDYHLRYCMNK